MNQAVEKEDMNQAVEKENCCTCSIFLGKDHGRFIFRNKIYCPSCWDEDKVFNRYIMESLNGTQEFLPA